jgi:hypothetical protein
LLALSILAYAGEIGAPKASLQTSTGRIAGNYKISKSYPLTKTVHGIDGVLQLLQDSRLTKDDYNKQYGRTGPDEMVTHKSALGAVLRIISKRKDVFRIVESHTYEVSVAWLEEVRLSDSDTPTYLFTLDKSTGMGSFTGPITYFYKVADGKIKPVEYLNNNTKKKEKMILMRSLKTAWKLTTSKDGKSKEILDVSCRPDGVVKSKDDDIFLIYYDRFHFNGKEWVKFERVEKGYWESEGEDDMPLLSKFPADL